MKPKMKFRGSHFGKQANGLWTPEHPGAVKGLVSNLAVYDDFDPTTGEGKLLHFDKEVRENTISSGASWNMLQHLFNPLSQVTQTGTSTNLTMRYQDANGFYFPNVRDLTGTTAAETQIGYNNASAMTFGSLVGLKGGSAGLTPHQTTIPNATLAWMIFNTTGAGFDWSMGNNFTSQEPTTTYFTFTATETPQLNGVPNMSWNITVTSTATAQQYTIDSVAWLPKAFGGSGNVYQGSTTNITNGVMTPLTPGVGYYSSYSSAPTTLTNLYVSALFVLPYLITVNPSGAFQFTYTFQGS